MPDENEVNSGVVVCDRLCCARALSCPSAPGGLNAKIPKSCKDELLILHRIYTLALFAENTWLFTHQDLSFSLVCATMSAIVQTVGFHSLKL